MKMFFKRLARFQIEFPCLLIWEDECFVKVSRVLEDEEENFSFDRDYDKS
jgi:hypothetical protein